MWPRDSGPPGEAPPQRRRLPGRGLRLPGVRLAPSHSSAFDAGCWGGGERAAGPSPGPTAACLGVCTSFPPTPAELLSQLHPHLPGEL